MKLKDRMFWNLAVVRGTYGFIGCVFSIYERYFDQDLWVHMTKGKTLVSSIIILNHTGFFLFEWPAQIFFDIKFRTFSKALHCHHIIALTGFLTTIDGDQSHYYACSAFILEMSTPFSCICYCLMKAGMADSLLWKINQMVLIHVFHLRSVVEFGMMYELWKYWEDFSQLKFLWRLNAISGLAAIGLFLTPYWTYRKTEQLFSKSDWNTGDNNNSSNNKENKKQKTT